MGSEVVSKGPSQMRLLMKKHMQGCRGEIRRGGNLYRIPDTRTLNQCDGGREAEEGKTGVVRDFALQGKGPHGNVKADRQLQDGTESERKLPWAYRLTGSQATSVDKV